MKTKQLKEVDLLTEKAFIKVMGKDIEIIDIDANDEYQIRIETIDGYVGYYPSDTLVEVIPIAKGEKE